MNDILKIGLQVVLSLCFVFCLVFTVDAFIRPKDVIAEYAYMEGQMDYMLGDIKIQRTETSYEDYEFICSPWNNDKPTTYRTRSEYIKRVVD